MNNQIQAIILAAGKSSRFNTTKTKLSFTICGQEMIMYPIRLFSQLKINTALVLGYQKEIILNILEKNKLNIPFVEQKEQLGTGHAALTTMHLWQAENVLIMNGDMPLVDKNIINQLIEKHLKSDATISFVTSHNSDPSITAYGRVIRNENKIKIVEAKDFKGDLNSPCCINAGIYIAKKDFLKKTLINLEKSSSGEFYITDLIKIADDANLKIETVDAPFDYIRGINTLKELWQAEQIKRFEIINNWMNKGVRFISPGSTQIDINVSIEPNTVIGTCVQIKNNTKIGNNCLIDAFSIIDNSILENSVVVHPNTIISDSQINQNSQVGPFAQIKKETVILNNAIIGNFVEISKSTIGSGTKAKHLSYIGNSSVGQNVNIGAGTITCNYNGVNKNNTIIEDNAFIGSNSSLVAPVKIGQGAIVAAGSCITENVEANDLAIARERQINKKDYAPKLKAKYKQQEEIKSAVLSKKETIKQLE